MCGSSVYTSRSTRNDDTPETVICDETTAGPVGTVTGVEFVNDVVLVGIACGSAVSASDQPFNVPTLPAVSSDTVSVQVPFGFSPMNAPSASSGVSKGTGTPFV